MNRIDIHLDDNQSEDQTGFRRSFSTMDHLIVINQLIEKYKEFNKDLNIAFIDYTKAFDSIEISYLLQARNKQEVPEKYVGIIKHIYTHAIASICLDKEGKTFSLHRGVKQGDPMSPKLFNALLESIFRRLNWTDKGLNIDGKRLNNLRFADDVALLSESKDELIQMIKELKEACKSIGLSMNEEKTKVMNNTGDDNYRIDNTTIEVVEDYKYLGHIVSFKNRQSKEIDARVSAAWRSFWAMKNYIISELPMFHKRKLMDCVILPILTYGAQTWSLTVDEERRIQSEQKSMERKILKLSLLEDVTNSRIRSIAQIKDALLHAKEEVEFCGTHPKAK